MKFYEIFSRFMEICTRGKPSGIMNHFTGINGLKGIVSNGKLWLTEYSSMHNDKSEGEYVYDIFNETLEEYYKMEKITKEFYNIIKDPESDFKKALLINEERYEIIDCTPYVICFSREKDDDIMGKRYYYGDKGGWISFKTDLSYFIDTGETLNVITDNSGLMGIFNVLYDKEEIKEYMSQLITDVCNANFSKKESIECISACLSWIRLIIKREIDDNDNITSIEKETRLILYVPNNNDDLEKYKNIIPSFKHVPKNNINNKNRIELDLTIPLSKYGISLTVHSHNLDAMKSISMNLNEKLEFKYDPVYANENRIGSMYVGQVKSKSK